MLLDWLKPLFLHIDLRFMPWSSWVVRLRSHYTRYFCDGTKTYSIQYSVNRLGAKRYKLFTLKSICSVSFWRSAKARNVRLYYPYRHENQPFHISICITTLPTQHVHYTQHVSQIPQNISKCTVCYMYSTMYLRTTAVDHLWPDVQLHNINFLNLRWPLTKQNWY